MYFSAINLLLQDGGDSRKKTLSEYLQIYFKNLDFDSSRLPE